MIWGRDYEWEKTDAYVPEDEPCFLIRGQDSVGHTAVRAWAHIYRTNGGSDTVYLSAMKQADRMEAWAKKKMADFPEGPK